MKKQHRLLHVAMLLVLAMACGSLWAQAPSGYYDGAAGKTGAELRMALHNIIKGHTSITYTQIWQAFWSTDNKGNNVVWDMYSDGANYSFSYQNGNDQCGNYDSEGDCYNREHSWPQSWFNEESTPRTDLHHVFPTDGYVNNKRSNYPFGEVGSTSWTSQNRSNLGTCRTSGYSGTVFEPIDEYKGDFARAYFYMSTRYYTEDSNWGTSDMTDKADIRPWAVAMLLRWHEADPVSQKEIDRNNVIYNDIQHNRNPFIDHPEYARMIWDNDWSSTYYAIIYQQSVHGNITGITQAVHGASVSITAIADFGYMVDTYSVWKTGDPSTTVTVSENGVFVMPDFDVTVSVTFVENTNYYAITTGTVQHGSISVSTNSAISGTPISMTATPAEGYGLYAWHVYKTGDMSTTVPVSGDGFVMPAYDVTVIASFGEYSTGGGDYVKVTEALTDWTGEYLIVYEVGGKAFNGAMTGLDGTPNSIDVTIADGTIASNNTTNSAKFTITKSGNAYTIKSASGYYIGRTVNGNGLEYNTGQAYTNTLTFNNNDNGDVDIVSSGGAYLRFNHAKDQQKFRYFKSGSYTNMKAIQLYKKGGNAVVAPTHTVHFYSNWGANNMPDQVVNEFEPTALNQCTYVRQGYGFIGWNTLANGSGTYYPDDATVTLLNDLYLYAQWAPLFAVTCQTVEHGTISASPMEASEGTEVDLTATPEIGYDLESWVVTDAYGGTVDVVDNQFVMPACNVTVSANFIYVGNAYEQKYYLVTSAEQLVANRTYLVVNINAGKALGSLQNENNRAAVPVEIQNNTIASIGSAVCELTLGGSTGAWTLFDANWGTSGGYLYAAHSSYNQLKTQEENDSNGTWAISIGGDSVATIVAQGVNLRNILRYNYNSGNEIFNCYANGQPQVQDVFLFVRSEEFEYTESITLANFNTFDNHVIRTGATVVANQVSGKDLCNNAYQIILEEGAQFVHGEAGIKALAKKAITAYSGNGGWYTISMPFSTLDPDEVENMTAADYDLYAYDEDGDTNGKEWINHKSNGGFSLSPSAGYLYAHNPAITLRMEGTLNVGTYSETVNLGYANGNASLQGFNLLGNPVAHDISFTKTAEVSDGYYYLANSNNWVYETGNTVPVGRGFMVKANASNQSVTLNPQSKRGEGQKKGQFLCVSVGEEKAYVKLNEGLSMPLLDMRGHHSRLYLQSERQPYVMLVRDGAEVLDLCYEAHGNGPQTLKVDTDGLGLNSLHLIDNKTGANVDLLATSSYQFEAKEGDYVTRFRLVFGPSTDSGSEGSTPFAYYADGEIRLSETCHDALLQIVDMTGRVVFMGDVSGNVSTKGMTPGVYVLRLVADDGIRVQKMVLK